VEEHVDELLAAYALGALEHAEALEVSTHLRHCRQCQIELEAYDDVTQALALAAPLHEPPARLKRAVLDHLETADRSGPAHTPAPWWRRFLPASWRQIPGWGWVSVLLVALLAVGNMALLGRLLGQQPTTGTTLQTITLQSTGQYPDATGLMVVGGDGRVGYLVVDHLPPPGEGRQYQLWLIHGEARESAGVFEVGEEGYGGLYMHTEKPLLSYTGFGITNEPEGGSPGPTGEKVLGIDF
jgi:anti-sigma-K factor RskA